MKVRMVWLMLLPLVSAQTVVAADEPVRVEMRTSRGPFVIELYPEQAPQTVDNFLRYVQDGLYDGTLFHRSQGAVDPRWRLSAPYGGEGYAGLHSQ